MGPPDFIHGVSEAFKKDTNPKKINLGVGAYRDDNGKPYVLPSVLKAEQIMMQKGLDKEYAPIAGSAEFCKLSIQLALGEDNAELKAGKVATVQAISGTGSVRLGCAFIKRFFPGTKELYISAPTWGNHKAVGEDSGLNVHYYKYFCSDTCGLRFRGFLEDICVSWRKLVNRAFCHSFSCRGSPSVPRSFCMLALTTRPASIRHQNSGRRSQRSSRRKTFSCSSTWPTKASPAARSTKTLMRFGIS